MDAPESETKLVDPAATMAVPTARRGRIASYPYHAGDLILPGYELVRRLGKGGFGEVWRATAPGGMGVAIKVIANLGRKEAGREYRALETIRNIRHAHIVPLFGVWLKSGDGRVLEDSELRDAEQRLLAGRSDGAAAMESLELVIAMGLGDQTLHDRLADAQGEAGAGPDHPPVGLPVQRLLEWFHQAALALDHFNAGAGRGGENLRAVQHCDIKPQNLLLVGDAVQVCDFGLARSPEEVRATSNTMASLAYAAPELLASPCEPSRATDQYSLALAYVELRIGRLPYAEVSPAAILRAKLDGAIDLAGLLPAEAVVVGKALALDPARRWKTCVEFTKALRSAVPAEAAHLPSEGVAADRTPAAGPMPAGIAEPAAVPARGASSSSWIGSPGRRFQLAAAGGVGGLAIAAASLLLFAPRLGNPPPAGAGTAPSAEPLASTAAAIPSSASREALDRDAAAAWKAHEEAAAAGRPQDAIPPLRTLERLYARQPRPAVEGLSRWHVVNSLAWYLATAAGADPDAAAEARGLAAEALALADSDPQLAALIDKDRLRREHVRVQSLDTAAAAAASAGDFPEAVRSLEAALAAATDPAERESLERRLREYRLKTEPVTASGNDG